MSDNHFNELNYVDQIDYNKRMTICDECKGIDSCKQDLVGLIPVITKSLSTGEWELSITSCGKQRGKWYSHLNIKSYTNLYKNDKRDDIVEFLLTGSGGFIYGDGGQGKTYTLGYIANEFNKQGKSIYFDLANNISNDVKNFDIKDRVLNDIYNADVFILDDFGGEQLTKFIIYNVWIPILKNRIDNGKTTYISSNYSLNVLADRIQKTTDTITATILLDRVNTLGIYNFQDKNYRMENVR